jgi:hypothetical protein
MGKSLIQTANQSTQSVQENSIINLGSTQRRYGCDLRLSGNAIEANGGGYFEIDVATTVVPTAVGNVTVAVYENGVQIPSAIAYGYVSTAATPITLPIVSTIRRGCHCEGADNLTLVLIEGAGDVTNVSFRVEKS